MRDVTCTLDYQKPLSQFLLTHPMRDVTVIPGDDYIKILAFLLTHPMRDVTPAFDKVLPPYHISTHTSHAGCDYKIDVMKKLAENFYSHIPCGM